MQVLLLTQVLPYPPDSGPRVKTYNVLKYLARQHQVTLVSYVRATDRPEAVRHLWGLCKAVHTVPLARSTARDLWCLGASLLRGQPWVMVRDDRAAMRQLVDRLAGEQRFDLVHADQLNMAQFALRVSGGQKVLDLHNALWTLYRRLWQTLDSGPKRWLFGRDWRLLRRYEAEMCRRFDMVLAVSEEDKRALIEVNGREDIVVIPIAIDTDEVKMLNLAPTEPHIVHIGTMFWPPNVSGILWFLREVYPRVKSRVPDVRCTLIGARPPQQIVQAGRTDPSLTVTGFVDNPEPLLRKSSLMVVPLQAGGGMRVKILNALAQGMPVVSTTLGCEGIAVTNDQDILIADEPAAFADAVVRLLTDSALRRRLVESGRRLVEKIYDYRIACRPLDAVYGSA
jgi:glycosyltransferase involved in cell wall biosynthesis